MRFVCGGRATPVVRSSFVVIVAVIVYLNLLMPLYLLLMLGVDQLIAFSFCYHAVFCVLVVFVEFSLQN